MRGHHPESCPRRVLQQGELWVDIEPSSGTACQRVYKASGTSQNGTCTFVNNDGNAQESDRDFAKKFTVAVMLARSSVVMLACIDRLLDRPLVWWC